MSWILIRHGMTEGNAQGRYTGGRTDEPLCPEGERALLGRSYPAAARVFVSPMLRCVQTAKLIWPGAELAVVEGFREIDFGAFEGRNHAELNGRADYQAWIDSGGEMAFPGGESRADFCARCVAAFDALRSSKPAGGVIVAHGGTIMAIMARYGVPAGGYYDYHVGNGEGYALHDGGRYERLFPDRT